MKRAIPRNRTYTLQLFIDRSLEIFQNLREYLGKFVDAFVEYQTQGRRSRKLAVIVIQFLR